MRLMFYTAVFCFISMAHARELHRIAFGSCNSQNHKQPLWQSISQQKPDLFIWGGDNVYAETKNPALIERAYEKQNQNNDYQNFKKQTAIIGTWDDHDYGHDNGNGTFAGKKLSQQYLLDFLDEPLDSPRRFQEGVYTSYEFGEGPQKVKIILLDNRYFKALDKDYPLLGKDQWTWLEAELIHSTASLHLIVAGLSILSPKMPITEEWADHRVELNRLLNLLKKHKVKAPLMLTGDKHFTSIFKRYGHLEFMASGMTHTAPKITRDFLRAKYPNTFFGLNYGLIEFEWQGSHPVVHLSARNRHGKKMIQQTYQWENAEWQRL